uniref:Uncharacterized protein n=1 Tax=Glossina austeni TaxID=7395 RepID=A0A1A9UM81_GLOAU
MVSSRDMENLLTAYDCCIDKEHRTFFLKMIDELRIYNNLSTLPFISSSMYVTEYPISIACEGDLLQLVSTIAVTLQKEHMYWQPSKRDLMSKADLYPSLRSFRIFIWMP